MDSSYSRICPEHQQKRPHLDVLKLTVHIMTGFAEHCLQQGVAIYDLQIFCFNLCFCLLDVSRRTVACIDCHLLGGGGRRTLY